MNPALSMLVAMAGAAMPPGAPELLMTRFDAQRGQFMGGRPMFVRDDVADALEQAGRRPTSTPGNAMRAELLSIERSLANGAYAWRRVRGER